MRQKNSLFADIMGTMSKAFGAIVAVVVIGILCSGIRTVQAGEVAIILRFGRLVGDTREEQIHEPGLMFAFPYIIDEVITVETGKVFEMTVNTHYTEGFMSSNVRDNGYIITGDQNIAVVGASVKYTISDPVAYALNTTDVATALNGVISGSLARGAVDMPIDSILTDGKNEYIEKVKADAQQHADLLELGVSLVSLELHTLSAPIEVKSMFESVNTAAVDAETTIKNAQEYYEKTIPAAEAIAEQKIADAKAEYSSAVAAAKDALSEFYGLLEEYSTNPDVVITRVYNDKLTQLLEKIGTVRLLEPGEETPGILLP